MLFEEQTNISSSCITALHFIPKYLFELNSSYFEDTTYYWNHGSQQYSKPSKMEG